MPEKESKSGYYKAVIRTGGKQFLVAPGQVLRVEKLEIEVGEKVNVPAVLVMENETGKLMSGSEHQISLTLKEQVRGEKIRVCKFKAKKRYRKTQGHRQYLSVVAVGELV